MSEKREFPILNGKLMSDLDANGHKIIGIAIDMSDSYLPAMVLNGKWLISEQVQFSSAIDLILAGTLNLRDSASIICRTANNIIRSSFYNDFSWIQDKNKRTLEGRLGELPVHYSLVKATPGDLIHLRDKTVTEVIADDSVSNVSFVFPEKIQGKARDFFIRLVVTGESVPTLSFTESNGDAVSFDTDDDSWAEIEQGVNILMFTDTAE